MVGNIKACVFPYRRDIKVNLLKKRQMLRGLETVSKWGRSPLRNTVPQRKQDKKVGIIFQRYKELDFMKD